MPGGTYSVTTVGSISAALSVGGGRSAGSFPEQRLVISVHYNNYIWSTYPMTITVRRSHINFINKIIIIIIRIIIRRRRRRRRRSKTVGISVKQTFVPTNQTIYCIVLLSFAFVICGSFLEPSGLDSHLPNICCKSVPSFDIGFPLCRSWMSYFFHCYPVSKHGLFQINCSFYPRCHNQFSTPE